MSQYMGFYGNRKRLQKYHLLLSILPTHHSLFSFYCGATFSHAHCIYMYTHRETQIKDLQNLLLSFPLAVAASNTGKDY